jgi:DNA-binding phage protein
LHGPHVLEGEAFRFEYRHAVARERGIADADREPGIGREELVGALSEEGAGGGAQGVVEE